MAISGTEREGFEKELEAYVGLDIGLEDRGRDPVNAAMVRHWCEAMGDACGAYTDSAEAAASVHGGLDGFRGRKEGDITDVDVVVGIVVTFQRQLDLDDPV